MAKAADCKSVTSETSKVRGLRSASVVAAGCASLVHWTSATFPAHYVRVSELVYSDYSKSLSSRWASVEELLAGISKIQYIDMEMLEKIVKTDSKQRYSFNEDKTLIRANQGHSIDVDVELPKKQPPVILYHGTGEKYVSSIDEQGLIPKSRLYVHLSGDEATATIVGSRHGRPVVYEVLASQMYHDDYEFFQSVNGVWLTKSVPVQYLKKLK